MLKKLFDKINLHKKEQTLEVLFKWFGKTVYLAAYGLVKDHYLAEEITQDTFVAAYLSYHQVIHNGIKDPVQPQKIVSDSYYID